MRGRERDRGHCTPKQARNTQFTKRTRVSAFESSRCQKNKLSLSSLERAFDRTHAQLERLQRLRLACPSRTEWKYRLRCQRDESIDYHLGRHPLPKELQAPASQGIILKPGDAIAAPKAPRNEANKVKERVPSPPRRSIRRPCAVDGDVEGIANDEAV